MQIVIDIPDEKVNKYGGDILEIVLTFSDRVVRQADGYAFYQLPKGHGRIADMDEAIKCIKDVEGEDAIWAISLIEWACSKRTLIEADNTESENKNE